MKVLITGATGLVGKQIGKVLAQKNHQIFVISRNAARAQAELPFHCEIIAGDLSKAPVKDPRLASIDAVIHLIGENVGDGKWTDERKQKILDSRIKGTHHLYQSLEENKKLLSVISASAVGYYGDCGDQEINEASQPQMDHQDVGASFLEKVCKEWEAAVISGLKAQFPMARDVIFRCGVILSRDGGAFPKMLNPFRKGFGSILGSGHQWMSWIHIDDLVRLFNEALESTDYEGVYNACAPHPVRNEEFTQRLANAVERKPLPLPVPAFLLRLALGEMATLALSSQRVIPQRLMSQGFRFDFAEISAALDDLCRNAPTKPRDAEAEL